MADQTNRDSYDGETENDGVSDRSEDPPSAPLAGSAVASGVGLEERLTEIFVDERDGDLLLQQSNREERVLQWLQALDFQVIGACRTDERLKPLLKTNVSNGVAEDRLLAHLSQHFEPVEVGMLARCFCIPLVSIRTGKISKQGTLLLPTNTRGNLNLTVLPTSDLRLSFVGDDGNTERLLTLSVKSLCSDVSVDEIPADNSGRSFMIKISDGQTHYFWCSEKSKLLGIELLAKMKEFLAKKPSIAELTGISEARLGCFATHLRAYLVGSTIIGAQVSSQTHQDAIREHFETLQDGQCSPASSKPMRSRLPGSQAGRVNSSFQGSLSPRSSSFKEGLSRNLSALKTSAREKLRRLTVDNLNIAATEGSLIHSEDDKVAESGPNFLDSLANSGVSHSPKLEPKAPFTATPLLSPYYCWSPPAVSGGPSQPPGSFTGLPSLPPLSSLLPASLPSSLLAQIPPFTLVDSPSLNFPAFLPDPLIRLQRPTAQQIPTFTPLFCDPIVHIPVIDICSSGPGYLVSAGPSLSTTIVNPLLPTTESMVEKGARETLRLLLSGSSQANPSLMMSHPLPAVLTQTGENLNAIVAGSASSIGAIGLVSLSGRSDAEAVVQRYGSRENSEEDDGDVFSALERRK